MKSTTVFPPTSDQPYSRPSIRLLLGILASLIVIFCWLFPFESNHIFSERAFLFQSYLPERDKEDKPPPKPASWIYADKGGVIAFGPIIAQVPLNFTNQGGANVFGDLTNTPHIEKSDLLIPGTEFAFGIWPGQNQTDYQQPIEFQITVNAAEVVFGEEQQLSLMMYNPDLQQWLNVPSRFQPETYQIVAAVQSFTPVPNEFPDWGGRTFFALFRAGTYVNRSANLRAGPSTAYAIIRQASPGQTVELVGQTRNRLWYKLKNGAWIASFLIDNAPDLPVVDAIPALTTTSSASTPSPKITSTAISTATSTPTIMSSPTVTLTTTPIITVTPAATAISSTVAISTHVTLTPTVPITTPPIKKIGILLIRAGGTIDLDESAIEDVRNDDILVEQVGDRQLFLAPLNGSTIALMDQTAVNFQDCARAEKSITFLDFELLQSGTYLCFLSTESRIIRLRISDQTDQIEGQLGAIYTIWEK